MKVMTVLFICTGNLCRSPMAEGILRDLLRREGIDDIGVHSAGTWGVEGEPAAPLAAEVCKERGIDLSGHVARRVSKEMLEASDLILVMEMDHVHSVEDLSPEALKRTKLLTHFGEEKDRFQDIADPYGKPKREYVACFERLHQHVCNLALEIIVHHDRKAGSSALDAGRSSS